MPHQDTPIVDVIASGVHDTKNVLFDALMRIGVAAHEVSGNRRDEALDLLKDAGASVEQATNRLSTLLSAYRLARHENPVVLMPVLVGDLVEYAALRSPPSAQDQSRVHIVRSEVCPDTWLLDRELVADCLVNATLNALRFAVSRIRISATAENGWLVIKVEDDGPGFSPELTSHPARMQSGVGLFVARRIAALHRQHGRHGRLILENGGAYGGAVFTLMLP